MRARSLALVSLAILVLAISSLVAAQEPAIGSGAAFREEVSVGWVLVPFSVRNRRGFVADLEPREVRLFADGEPIVPDSFDRGSEATFELVLLHDLSGSMALGGRLEASRRVADCFLDGLRPGDRYAMATFAGRSLTVEVPFTADPTAGLEAADAWQPYGVTALHDAVARLPEIRATGQAAGAAVLITDGAENASRLDPKEAREIVRRARLPVYVLSLAQRRPRPGSPPEGEDYAAVLRRLAAATGGRYFSIGAAADLAESCRSVIDELRSRYVLGFPTAGGESRWRRLRVEVKRRGVEIRSRAGYHGPPPVFVEESPTERRPQ
ncbi:MAG: VWA domain-containing protein [Thermoanaerobaculia bacterium]